MVEIFKLLGEDNRYRIFTYLAQHGESCVCDLESLLDLKQANLSKHLKKMKEAGILSSEHKGNFVHYQISESFKSEHNEFIEMVLLEASEEKLSGCCEVKE